ncbi:RNA-directed DNA polymerase from mobile element jockey-like [Brachionus plicatilis]|uniref:RNA-directed DNA polymerase from mobile element jockey-like n=1 Tax=Brachionus plicatilis TaxID=10195 RepID=A0A3M7QYN5_BRAPC|nr:RNA-directed DNA polymerase from mobile element jockey-like [Brachionus plicatilis]
MIWCNVTLDKDSLVVGCIYRPPQSFHDSNRAILKAIAKSKIVTDRRNSGLVIAGDFNHPDIKWTDLGATFGTKKGRKSSIEMADSSNRHVLEYTEVERDLALSVKVGRTRRSSKQQSFVRPIPANSQLREHFFTYRVTMPWNALPQEIVQSISVNQFKNRLDTYRRKEKPTMDEVMRLGRIDIEGMVT